MVYVKVTTMNVSKLVDELQTMVVTADVLLFVACAVLATLFANVWFVLRCCSKDLQRERSISRQEYQAMTERFESLRARFQDVLASQKHVLECMRLVIEDSERRENQIDEHDASLTTLWANVMDDAADDVELVEDDAADDVAEFKATMRTMLRSLEDNGLQAERHIMNGNRQGGELAFESCRQLYYRLWAACQ